MQQNQIAPAILVIIGSVLLYLYFGFNPLYVPMLIAIVLILYGIFIEYITSENLR